MLRNKRFWIGIIVSGILLFFFLYNTDFAEMGRAFQNANYVFLLPGIIIYFFGVYFRALRWRFLLSPLGKYSSLRLFPLIIIGFMVNNILPGRLGIVVRAYILGEKERVSKMSVGGTVVSEQVFDGITLMLFAAIISLVVPLSGAIQQVVYVAAGLFIAALLFFFTLAFSQRFTRKGIALVLLVLPNKWHAKVELWLLRFVDGLKFMRSPRKLFMIMIASSLVWLCEAGLFYMVALSFNLGQPFHIMLLVTSIASLSWALIFAAPGGVGPFDYFCKVTLMLFIPAGVATSVYEAAVSAYVVVLHAVLLLPMIALGFVFLWRENLTLAKLVGGRSKPIDKIVNNGG